MLVARARERWPDLDLADDVFASYVAARRPTAEITGAMLNEARAEDLYLACACARGDARAVAAFERTYARDIAAIVARFKAPPSFHDEVKQMLGQRLFVAAPGKRPGIEEYAGRGELLAFVRVVAVRIALDLLRKQGARVEVGDDDLWALPAAEDDPELQYMKVLYRDEFKAAFEAALRALPARERALLRYQLVDKLSIDKIATIYDLHRSTIARQINRARRSLIAGTRRSLASHLDIDQTELDSIMRLIESNVDLSIERLLTSQRE